jgi:sugar phosphate isomerase/epimerase
MKTMKGPGIFLAQFIGAQAPFNTLDGMAQWAAGLGYQALQIPCNHPAIFDVERAATSQTYCDDSRRLAEHGLVISELSTHLEGQLVAVHPAYDAAFDAFAPPRCAKSAGAPAVGGGKVRQAAVASARLGLQAMRPFPDRWRGLFYPWPPHNQSRIDEAFDELARRWRPLLDLFDEQGIDVCYEIHPGEDLHDGVTFERFLQRVITIRAAICSMTQPLHLSRWTTWRISISTIRGSKLSRQRCRVSSRRPQRRLRRLSALAAAGGALSLARGRADRFQRHFQQADRI